MPWYLIHTKPRQEQCARINLENQGYECYFPLLSTEKHKQGQLVVSEEPLFPRYVFLHCDENKGLGAIRSTKGVSRLVTFGSQPAVIADALIHGLRMQEVIRKGQVRPLFHKGERVIIREGVYADFEAIYTSTSGNDRVIVLIEMLSRQVPLQIPLRAIYKQNR